MQFSIIGALVAFLATSAIAAPAHVRRQCDIKTCILDLAPSVVTCASAAAQVDLDPISDIGCLIAAVKEVKEFPPSCSACI